MKISTYQEVSSYFKNNKLKNIVLFSQARSGSTFITHSFSKYLGFKKENVFIEEYFQNKHFVYLKNFLKKHDNFFLNTNEFVYSRIFLKKNETLFIYLYRDEEEILSSYKKAKKLGYYLGWEEFYEKYKKLFPNIDSSVNVPKFNHLVWESQISSFDHALTLSYSSFTDHPDFIKNRSIIKKLKQIGKEEKNLEIKLNNKINFSFFEKIYFLIRRKIESRKKDMKNY
tara:strand:+ start:277 stop:957 length:681 start_codon:yes stop_codon:yes gene_type:complete